MGTSEENRNQMLSILAEVDAARLLEGTLQAEKTRLEDQIKTANDELITCENNISQCHDNMLALRRQMDELKDVIFHREDEAPPIIDESHIPTEGGSPESEARRLWRAEAKRVKLGAA
jgi:chromosome segregation ATPase